MTLTSSVLTLEMRDHVATLWLDRPETRNAMGAAFWRDLPNAVRELRDDPNVRVVIVAARGPHFSVGLDLRELGSDLLAAAPDEQDPAAIDQLYRRIRDMQTGITALAELAMPTIAAIHGYCIGGGVDLISALDIRLGSADAVFSVRETKMAMVADMGSLQRLPSLLSAGVVNELVFTGDDVAADRAERLGLLNRVVDGGADEVYAAATELASRIAANSPLVVRGAKAVLRYNEGHDVDDGLDFVARWNARHLPSHDLEEALRAFLEKRPAHFRGD